jgi:hypothetical protein
MRQQFAADGFGNTPADTGVKLRILFQHGKAATFTKCSGSAPAR